MERNLHRIRRIGEIKQVDTALIPSLHHNVPAGHRNQRTIVSHTVFCGRLGCRHFEITLKFHLPVPNRKDRIGTPFVRIRVAAFGLHSTTPLIGKHDRGSLIIKRGRVPVGKIGICHRIQPSRGRRIGDVQQNPIPFTRSTSQAYLRIERNIVALVGSRPLRIRINSSTHHRIDPRLKIFSQDQTVCRRRRPLASTLLHHLVQQIPQPTSGNHSILTPNIRYIRTLLFCLPNRIPLGTRWSVLWRCHQPFKNTR